MLSPHSPPAERPHRWTHRHYARLFAIDVTGTQTSSDESCVAGDPAAECTTAGFIASHFAGPYTTPTYFFHYAGYDGSNQALVAHEWKNASDDRGGNHGDIATE